MFHRITLRKCVSCFMLLCLYLPFTTSLTAQTLIIPHSIDADIDKKEQNQDIDFYQYPYLSEKIDLRAFKRRYPDLEAPDFITIQAPDLSEFQSTIVLLGLLSGEKADSNAVVIWIAGDYFSDKVSFFVDDKMDRNYLNDGAPIVLTVNQEPRRVLIYPSESLQDIHELWLQVPKNPKFKNFTTKNKKTKIAYQFAVGIHGGVGSGSLNYQFDNLERGFPTWYTVNFAEKNIGLSFNYSLPRFRVELSATLQNHFYYTSYLNIRFDNPEFKVNANTGQRIKIDNVLVDRNKDSHSKNGIQWALFTAYRWHLGETIELQPILGVGKTMYLSREYVADQTGDQEIYKLPASTFAEGGLQFEFTTGHYKAFFIGLAYHKVWWEPESYFESIPHENLEIQVKTWKFKLGYRIAIK